MDLKFGTPLLLPTSTRVQCTGKRRAGSLFKTPYLITKDTAIETKGRITARGAAQRTFSAHSSVQQTYKRSPLQQEGTATASDGALSSGE